MPSEQEHLVGAASNRALAHVLLEHADPSWAAVLAFYCALHLVNAYLIRMGISVQSHRTRDTYIARMSDLIPIYENYRRLESHSRWVRYDLRKLSPAEVKRLMADDLAAIESTITNLLRPSRS
jgi:hypothetical protein